MSDPKELDRKIDKVFDLLEKMYIEFCGRFDKQDKRMDAQDCRFDRLESRMDAHDSRFDRLENRQTKLELAIENDIKPGMKLLFEQAQDNTRLLQEHSKRLDSIDSKLETLTVTVSAQNQRLTLVESGKKRAK